VTAGSNEEKAAKEAAKAADAEEAISNNETNK